MEKDYPWVKKPVIVGAPMRLIALAKLAVEVSKAGGLGFIGAGTDVSILETELLSAQRLLSSTSLPTSPLPIGIGFINWGASLSHAIPLIQRFCPAAVWLFAPRTTADLVTWTTETRKASSQTKVWVQIGSVADAVEVVRAAKPDVLVVQGTDAGGHGLAQGAGIISLFPEVEDRVREVVKQEKDIAMPTLVAAGGIVDGRGVAAALALGAEGVVLGTRLLASKEANISQGYKDEVVRARDGGQTTVRTKVYDGLRGTTGWSEGYNARGVVNRSYVDAIRGMDEKENKRLYEEEMKKGDQGWGVEARMTTYAGSAVGLVREVKGTGEIVEEVREGAKKVLERFEKGALTNKL